jgi:hypothetical protein
MNDCITPGKLWLDTNGKRIQAHGAAMFYENETYYWYGENKENTNGKNKIWTSGIRCYSSKDFYNWTDEGLMIPPNLSNKRDPLYPSKRNDRPHIVLNPNTGKYVCWIKEIEKGFHIYTADTFLGLYTCVKHDYKPFGLKAGDFDFCFDEQTGKAYIFWASERKGMFLAELAEDFLSVTGQYKRMFDNLYPPFTREAPCHFMRNGKHYLVTSGMTGYVPNPSEVAVCDDWLGEYKVICNLHVDDASSASFNSQISYVFKHPNIDDLYIAMADRWVPDFPVDKEKYDWFTRVIGSNYDKKKYKAAMKDKLELIRTPLLGKANTSIADCVWLPVTWNGDMPEIRWRDRWSLTDVIQRQYQ